MNTMKYILTFIFLLFIVLLHKNNFAQHNPSYTQQMANKLAMNPAYAGSNDLLSFELLARNQWMGFTGAPQSRTFSVHTPIPDYQFGTGLTLINDQIGPSKQNSAYFNFAFHLPVEKKSILSMGIKAGVDVLSLNYSDLNIIEADDPSFNSDFKNILLGNFGLGIYYLNPIFYLSLSTPTLYRSMVKNDGLNTNGNGFQNIHFQFSTGFIVPFDETLKIKPSIHSSFVGNSPISFNISVLAISHDRVWFGLNYRIQDAVGAIVQVQINNLMKVGYSYDFTTSLLNQYTNGTHEIAISYDIDYNKKKKKYSTPRYF